MSAVISDCGLYRYRLERRLSDDPRVVVFVMLNPSTADAEQDDPTIRRCKSFAASLGAGRLVVVNLFAFRATDPADMKAARDPVGPENDKHISAAAAEASWLICAWGTHGSHARRDGKVLHLLRQHDLTPMCLGKTAQAMPRHPLYLPKAAVPVPYGV